MRKKVGGSVCSRSAGRRAKTIPELGLTLNGESSLQMSALAIPGGNVLEPLLEGASTPYL